MATNDYAGLTVPLMAGAGTGGLPPVVQPALLREGRLAEVMADRRSHTFPLSLLELRGRQAPRPVRLFKTFGAQVAPTLFGHLPS